MAAFVTAPAGFLLAVLWFDLMFDVQSLRYRGRTLPDDVLESIAAYYRRVTTKARPMNYLVAATMVAALAAIAVQVIKGDDPRWVGVTTFVLASGAVGLAAGHTVAKAVLLGSGRGGYRLTARIRDLALLPGDAESASATRRRARLCAHRALARDHRDCVGVR